MRTEAGSGPGGSLKATRAAVTRLRTALEGSKRMTVANRLALTPSIELGIRQDGGDADVGAGLDLTAGLVLADSVTGLAVDLRVRRLLIHQAAGFAESGMAVSVSYDPSPGTPLGFTARVAPAWGGDAMSGAEALWGRDTMGGMGGTNDPLLAGASGVRLDTEVGYGLPMGSRFVGTPRVGVRTSEYGRTIASATAYRSSRRVHSGYSSASRPNGGSAPSSGSWATPAAEQSSGSSDRPASSGNPNVYQRSNRAGQGLALFRGPALFSLSTESHRRCDWTNDGRSSAGGWRASAQLFPSHAEKATRTSRRGRLPLRMPTGGFGMIPAVWRQGRQTVTRLTRLCVG